MSVELNAYNSDQGSTESASRHDTTAVDTNFLSGFNGAGSIRFTPEEQKVLHQAVNPDDVAIRPDGIIYLPGVFFRRVLTEAFGSGAWAMCPRSPAMRAPSGGGELVMYHGALVVQGRYAGEAVGQCLYYPKNRGMTYADAFEGAKTDCVSRCAKDLLVASELWEPTWRENWQAKYATKDREGKWYLKTKSGRADVPTGATTAAPTQSVPAAKPAAASAPTPSRVPTASNMATGVKPAVAADSGEACSDKHADELRDFVLNQLGWKPAFARLWLSQRFGSKVARPEDLTVAQMATASKLLMAFANPKTYEVLLETFVRAGLVIG